MSVSPSPDLELHGRIRSSPSALYSAAAAYGASCSRSSSTSGSYGHLNPLAFTMQHHPSVISPQVQQLLRSASGLHLPWHNAASMPSAAHHASYNMHMLPVHPQDSSQVSHFYPDRVFRPLSEFNNLLNQVCMFIDVGQRYVQTQTRAIEIEVGIEFEKDVPKTV